MLDKQIEKAIIPITKMYAEIENDLLELIINDLLIGGEFTNSDIWRIQKLNDMGLFNNKVIEYISKRTNISKKALKTLLEDINVDVYNNSGIEQAFKDGKLEINPKIIENNLVIQAIINNHYDDLSNTFIQLNRRIVESTKRAYLQTIEKCALSVATGDKSYSEVIRSAIIELSNKGIDTLDYTNDGKVRHYDISSTARREILTSVRQLSGDLNNYLIEETKCEYVKISEHLDCREEHLDWQGMILPKETWKQTTDYGSITGIYGINCRHYAEPYFEDARGSELKKYSAIECEDKYMLVQQQRYIERNIRAWKRKEKYFKEASELVTDEEIKENMLIDKRKSHTKLLEWNNRLIKYCKDNNLQIDYSRLYIG